MLYSYDRIPHFPLPTSHRSCCKTTDIVGYFAAYAYVSMPLYRYVYFKTFRYFCTPTVLLCVTPQATFGIHFCTYTYAIHNTLIFDIACTTGEVQDGRCLRHLHSQSIPTSLLVPLFAKSSLSCRLENRHSTLTYHSLPKKELQTSLFSSIAIIFVTENLIWNGRTLTDIRCYFLTIKNRIRSQSSRNKRMNIQFLFMRDNQVQNAHRAVIDGQYCVTRERVLQTLILTLKRFLLVMP